MEKRYEEDLKELKERMKLSFEVLEEEGKVKIKELSMGFDDSLKSHILEVNLYSHNYTNPPIPEGYEYIEGTWNTGFVIEREDDASQFVWIPVGSLKPNGTLSGKCFCEKFGRRKFNRYFYKKFGTKICNRFSTEEDPSIFFWEDFFHNEFEEKLEGRLLKQLESVKKYGGFYVSRFLISHRELPGEHKSEILRNLGLQSKRGEYPSHYTGYSKDFEDKDEIKAHLIYGAEYDSMIEWLLETKAITLEELNSAGFKKEEDIIYNTGSRKTVKLNNIFDFGNVDEFTSELDQHCIRKWYNPTIKESFYISKRSINEMGFRLCLYLK